MMVIIKCNQLTSTNVKCWIDQDIKQNAKYMLVLDQQIR